MTPAQIGTFARALLTETLPRHGATLVPNPLANETTPASYAFETPIGTVEIRLPLDPTATVPELVARIRFRTESPNEWMAFCPLGHLKLSRPATADADSVREFVSAVLGFVDSMRAGAMIAAFDLVSTRTDAYVANAFSFNMLPPAPSGYFLQVRDVSADEAADWYRLRSPRSAVGHADTAAIFSSVLGVDVPMNRESVSLADGDAVLVGQYSGPRLPEGATALPVGAKIRWVLAVVCKG